MFNYGSTIDHFYSALPLTPSKEALKMKLTFVQHQLVASRKKVKVLLQSKRHLIAREAGLADVIADLWKQMLMRHVNKQLGKPTPMSYSADLRSFELTLHFYSPHAYCYVRKVTLVYHTRELSRNGNVAV